MEWDPLEVAYDGMFCDAVGMATDGYFCDRGKPAVFTFGQRVKKPDDRRDLRDIVDILAILSGAKII